MWRKLQFLFLTIIYRLNILSIIHSLLGNCMATYQDPNKILKAYEAVLTPSLFNQLKRVLCYHNLSKLRGHITVQ